MLLPITLSPLRMVGLYVQDILGAQRLIRPVLHFQNHRTTFQGADSMPLAGGDVHSDHGVIRGQMADSSEGPHHNHRIFSPI